MLLIHVYVKYVEVTHSAFCTLPEQTLTVFYSCIAICSIYAFTLCS